MPELLFHNETKKAIVQFTRKPSHALLIIGSSGTGKSAVALHIASKTLGISYESLPADKVKEVSSDKAISIDKVRSIQHFLTLKTFARSGNITRVVIVHNAHTMTLDAQNALLKTLEEVPNDSIIILTTTAEHALLPTVVSRTQKLHITVPTKTELTEHFMGQGFAAADIERAYAISGGAVGLMHALLTDSGNHPTAKAAKTAREFLSQSQFERLATIDTLAKDRELAINTCELLTQMAHLAISSPKVTPDSVRRWQKVMQKSMATADELRTYAQPKLVLTSLALSI